MYDPNLFAVLTACDLGDRARGAFALPANVHFFLAETGDFVQEPTPARPPSPEAASRLGHRILLHLDRLPKDPRRGWLFGTDPGVCDVVLGHPGTPGISREHFSITLDLQFQVEIFNWSRFGAAVRCNGGLRTPGSSKCKRLLSFEPGFSRGWEEVMVYVPNVDGLAFKIDFPNHRTGRREYRRNLRSFLRRCDAAPAPVRGWGLGSMASHSPLDALTVCYDDGAIGRSRFGLVRRLVDVHKGRLYAAKTFNVKGPTDENRRLREIGWFDGIEEDVAKVNKDPHQHVMHIIAYSETPEPFLLMPFYPMGSLEDIPDLGPRRYLSTARQMLLGLHHLHERGVVHRNLKPANLVVTRLDPLSIVVSDFGLSKLATVDALLNSFSGTRLYAAPEVVPVGNRIQSTAYLASVDIWSAGIIMLESIVGRPRHARVDHLPVGNRIEVWSDIVVRQVADLARSNDSVVDIIKHMVVKMPQTRLSAGQCLQRACGSGLFRRDNGGQIVDVEDAPARGNHDGRVVGSDDATSQTAAPDAEAHAATNMATLDAAGARSDDAARPTRPSQVAAGGGDDV